MYINCFILSLEVTFFFLVQKLMSGPTRSSVRYLASPSSNTFCTCSQKSQTINHDDNNPPVPEISAVPSWSPLPHLSTFIPTTKGEKWKIMSLMCMFEWLSIVQGTIRLTRTSIWSYTDNCFLLSRIFTIHDQINVNILTAVTFLLTPYSISFLNKI